MDVMRMTGALQRHRHSIELAHSAQADAQLKSSSTTPSASTASLFLPSGESAKIPRALSTESRSSQDIPSKSTGQNSTPSASSWIAGFLSTLGRKTNVFTVSCDHDAESLASSPQKSDDPAYGRHTWTNRLASSIESVDLWDSK